MLRLQRSFWRIWYRIFPLSAPDNDEDLSASLAEGYKYVSRVYGQK